MVIPCGSKPARSPLLRLLLLLLLSGCASAGELVLIAPSGPPPVIVLPANPHPDEELAARELRDHLEKITGVSVKVGPAGGGPVIWLGRAAPLELETLARRQSDDPATFAYRVGYDGVAVRGLSPEGTLFGVYALLESLGVRWFMPGEMGTVIPSRERLALPFETRIEAPSFASRHLQGGKGVEGWEQWCRRMRLGGAYFPGAHGLRLGKALPFEKYPEAWAMVGGRRRPTQQCVSNPLVVEKLTEVVNDYFRQHPKAEWIGLGPNDGGGYCTCPECRALDGGDRDPHLSAESMTDRYVWLFNQVLKGLEPRFKDRSIAFYAYLGTRRPPVRFQPDRRLVPALAPIMLCRIHGPGNPLCPDRDDYGRLLKGWKALVPRVYDRGYWTNLNDPGLPFQMMHRLRSQIPLAHSLGVEGWRVECFHNWAAESPSLYVACKLMWDHRTDVDALISDFAQKYYGPSAEPMEDYHRLMDAALRDGDFHAGGAWEMPRLYPPEVRARAAALFEEADLQADRWYVERVHSTRLAFIQLEGFIEMMEARNRGDFAAAQEGLNKVLAMQARLASTTPPLINVRLSPKYLADFYSPAVVDGRRLAAAPNRILAVLPDVWQFRKESSAAWRPLQTFGASWASQGLADYRGRVRYRQTVELGDLPAQVFVWVGGVDEKAEFFLNGVRLGESSVPAFHPFELPATGAARPGVNHLELLITNEAVNEVGTGGLTGPVVLYGR